MKIFKFCRWVLLFADVSRAIPGIWRRQTGSPSESCTCPANGPLTTTTTPVVTLTSTITIEDGTSFSTGPATIQIITVSSISTITVTTGTTTITYPGITETTTGLSTSISTITVTTVQTNCATTATRKVKRQASVSSSTASTTDPPPVLTTVLTVNSTLCTCTCTYVPQPTTLASSSTCECPATTGTLTITADPTTSVITETTATPTIVVITPAETSTIVVTSFVTSSALETATTTEESSTITSESISIEFTTVTSTIVTCPSTSSTTSSAAPSATVPLICNSTAYLIGTLNNSPTLYNIDLSTSYYYVVNGRVGLGAYTAINAMGYNVLDNYLYAVGTVSSTVSAVLRISATGVTQEITRLTLANAATAGDIDTDGQFWFTSSGGTQWRQIDLAPGSSTYGQTKGSGNSTLTGYGVYDWVYLPGQGNYMYSLAQSTGSNQHLSILRWSQTTHTWTEYQSDTNTAAANAIIANWGSNNATIWGLAATSGDVVRQSLGSSPVRIGTAPGTLSYADGARCALSTE